MGGSQCAQITREELNISANTSTTATLAMRFLIIFLLLSTTIMAKPNPQTGDHFQYSGDHHYGGVTGDAGYSGGRHHYASGSVGTLNNQRYNSPNIGSFGGGQSGGGGGQTNIEGAFTFGSGSSAYID